MKKFIQIYSLLSLLVLFPVAATHAQGFGTDVDIPFDFNVGDRSYEAGNYIVKLDRRSAGMATLTIQNTKTDESQTVLLNVGPESRSGEVNLVFDTLEGRRYLTKVQTPERTYALLKSKTEKNAIRALNSEKASEAAVIQGAANLF